MKMFKSFLASLLIGLMSSYASAYDSNTHTIIPGTGTHNSGDLEVNDLQLSGSDIVDANGTTRLTVGSTNALTGNATVSGTLSVTGATTFTGSIGRPAFGLQLSSAPRTSNTLTYNSTGTLALNTQDSQVCVSTSVNQNSFVQMNTTAPLTGAPPCAH